MRRAGPEPSVVFKLALLFVFILTLACFVMSVILATLDDPSELAEKTADNLSSAATLGMGALVGLIGGKTL